MSKTGKFTEMESRLVVARSLEWLQIQGYFWGDENSQIRQWWFSNNFVNILKATEMSTFQFSSVAQSSPTLCDPMNRSTPGLPVHHQLPESTQTHAHQVGDAIQPSHPVVPFSSCPPIPPSIRVFSNESTLHMRWPEYWSFSFSISLANEHPGLKWVKLYSVWITSQ